MEYTRVKVTHKGFVGLFEPEDNCFHGKIANIDDLVTIWANNEKDINEEFIIAVEDYLNDCKELGREPKFKSLGD